MRRLIITTLWIASLIVAFEVGQRRASAPASRQLSDVQMEQAVTQALADPDYFQCIIDLSRLLDGVRDDNIAGAVRAFDEHLEAARGSEIQLLMHAWARLDPVAAFEHVRGWDRAKRAHALPALAMAWGMRNPVEAAGVLSEIKDNSRDDVISGLVNGWLSSGMSGVDDFIARLPPDALKMRLTATLVAHWLRERGIDPVIEWVEKMPEREHDDFKHTAFLRAANQIAERDPLRAAAWVDANLEHGYAAGGVEQVARKWIQSDADAAFAWLATVKSATERDFAVFSGYRRWLNVNRAAAQKWLEDTERAPIHDWALVMLARELKSTDPAKAASSSERIEDRELRIRSLAEVASAWGRSDRAAAAAWFHTSEFAPEIREAMKTQRGVPRPPSPALEAGRQAVPASQGS